MLIKSNVDAKSAKTSHLRDTVVDDEIRNDDVKTQGKTYCV